MSVINTSLQLLTTLLEHLGGGAASRNEAAVTTSDSGAEFEEKYRSWVKAHRERHGGY